MAGREHAGAYAAGAAAGTCSPERTWQASPSRYPHRVDGAQQRGDEAASRLRGLLRAQGTIIGVLDLQTVLRRIVEAACELVDAPYGALGVIAPDGTGLEQFIHVGMDAGPSRGSATCPRARACSGP